MPRSQTRGLKSDHSSGTDQLNSTFCPDCGTAVEATASTRGRNKTRAEWDCPNCDASGPQLPTTERPVVTDGGSKAYEVLSHLNDPSEHSDRLQEFLDDDLHVSDLTPADIVEPLKLALGKLCLQITHDAKTEVIWVSGGESLFVSKTSFDAPARDDWGPIAVRERAIAARIHEGKDLTIRTFDGAALSPPDAARCDYDPDLSGSTNGVSA